MATIKDLVKRTLQEMQVLAAGETPSAEDEELVTSKLMSVHAYLRQQGLLRWTTQDIPDYAEEGYVLMGAFIAQAPYAKSVPPSSWSLGLAAIQSGVSLPATDTVRAEYF